MAPLAHCSLKATGRTELAGKRGRLLAFGGQPGQLLLIRHLGAQAHGLIERHLLVRVASSALALPAAQERGRLRWASQHHLELLGRGIEQSASRDGQPVAGGKVVIPIRFAIN